MKLNVNFDAGVEAGVPVKAPMSRSLRRKFNAARAKIADIERVPGIYRQVRGSRPDLYRRALVRRAQQFETRQNIN